ncbi:MAG: hypothetical protein Q6K55_12460 [Thermostichus sp. DG02_3_bins_51]
MNRETALFGLKLMLAAAGISVAIKYGGPYLALPERMPVVIGMILLPALVLAGILWRWQQQSPATPVKKGSLAAEEAEPEKSSQPDLD